MNKESLHGLHQRNRNDPAPQHRPPSASHTAAPLGFPRRLLKGRQRPWFRGMTVRPGFLHIPVRHSPRASRQDKDQQRASQPRPSRGEDPWECQRLPPCSLQELRAVSSPIRLRFFPRRGEVTRGERAPGTAAPTPAGMRLISPSKRC